MLKLSKKYNSAGIVQFRILIILGEENHMRRKRQSSTTADIIETVSCSYVYALQCRLTEVPLGFHVSLCIYIPLVTSCGYKQ